MDGKTINDDATVFARVRISKANAKYSVEKACQKLVSAPEWAKVKLQEYRT